MGSLTDLLLSLLKISGTMLTLYVTSFVSIYIIYSLRKFFRERAGDRQSWMKISGAIIGLFLVSFIIIFTVFIAIIENRKGISILYDSYLSLYGDSRNLRNLLTTSVVTIFLFAEFIVIIITFYSLYKLSRQEEPAIYWKVTLSWQSITSFWKEFTKSRIGMIGLGILFAFTFVAIFAPQLAPYDPYQRNPLTEDGKYDPEIYPYSFILNSPMEGHRLGTDYLNRDIFSQLIHGTRISLTIGILAATLVVGIGTLVGLVAGFMGGTVDDVLMRATDLVLIMPMLPLMIVLAMILGRSMYNIIIVIGILVWPSTARMVRASTLSLRERSFVEASRSVGASRFRLIFVHVLPNVIPLVFATMVLQVGSAILTEASLSFLGLGDPTRFSWGKILFDAFDNQALAIKPPLWWYILPPGFCISLVVLGFIFFSYGLDRVVNPRLRIERWSEKTLDKLFKEGN